MLRVSNIFLIKAGVHGRTSNTRRSSLMLTIELFSLGGLFPHFRPCGNTFQFLLSSFQVVARVWMIDFLMDEKNITWSVIMSKQTAQAKKVYSTFY